MYFKEYTANYNFIETTAHTMRVTTTNFEIVNAIKNFLQNIIIRDKYIWFDTNRGSKYMPFKYYFERCSINNLINNAKYTSKDFDVATEKIKNFLIYLLSTDITLNSCYSYSDEH